MGTGSTSEWGRTVKISKFCSHPNTFHGFTTMMHDEEDDSCALGQHEEPLTPGTGEQDQRNKVKPQNEPLARLNAHLLRTRAGSCWLRRTGWDRSRHTAAGGQRSDSDPQRFVSTGSSAAEAAVLWGQGGSRRTLTTDSGISGGKRFAEVSPSKASSKIQNPNILFNTNTKQAPETQETRDHTNGSRAFNI